MFIQPSCLSPLNGFSIQPHFSAPNTTVVFLLRYHNNLPTSNCSSPIHCTATRCCFKSPLLFCSVQIPILHLGHSSPSIQSLHNFEFFLFWGSPGSLELSSLPFCLSFRTPPWPLKEDT